MSWSHFKQARYGHKLGSFFDTLFSEGRPQIPLSKKEKVELEKFHARFGHPNTDPGVLLEEMPEWLQPHFVSYLEQIPAPRRGRGTFPEFDLDRQTQRLKNKVVWLDPIYMYEDGNPIVALMVRIEHAATQQGYGRGFGGWNAEERERDFSLGMHGAAMAHSGPSMATDVDTRAIEILQTEHVRLNFPKQFKSGFEGIVEFFQRRGIREPVFCLPLMDYDLHFATHQPFVDLIEHYLLDGIEVFIVGDGELPTLRINRNKDKFHVLDTEQFVELVKRLK